MTEEQHAAGNVDALLAAARVSATERDLAGVRALYRRFAGDRARLRSRMETRELGEVEPLTIVVPDAATREAS